MNPKRLADACLTAVANPIERILLLAVISGALTLCGVAKDRQEPVLKEIGLVAAAALLARGYHLGKAAEGTVPPGSQPVPGSAVNISVGAGPSPEDAGAVQQVASEVQQAQTIAAAAPTPQTTPQVATGGPPKTQQGTKP